MADSKSGTGGSVSCPRCQKNVNPYKLGGAHDCTPSLAGTAETMTAEDAAWIVERGWLSPEGKARADRVAATYAALAEKTDALEETERALRGFEKLAANRWDELTALRASLATAQEALRCRPAVLPDLDLGYDAATCDNCGKAQVGEEAEEPLCDECWAKRTDAARPHATPEGEDD